jgi:hypothetical protein
MRLVYGPEDLDGYAAARDRLRLLIVAWARRRGQQVEPSLVAAALDHKHSVDGRLGHWTRGHVADALAVWFPRTVALLEDDREAVPTALHAVIGFLAENEWLDCRSDDPAALHAQVLDSTPALHDALDDERNHDLGTFWALQMLRHRVPTADPSAVARFLAQVDAGELEIDRDALDEIMRRQTVVAPEPPPAPLPPVLLPGAAALLSAADASPALARLRAFTRWVRAGRTLRDGRLLLGDAHLVAETLDLDHFSRGRARTSDDLPEISLLLHWARQARLVRVLHGRLVPVKSAAPLLSRPIELWRRVFEAVGGLGDHFGGSNVFGAPSLFGMALGEALQLLLHMLYAAGGDPVPVERFHRAVRDTVNRQMGCVVDDLAGDVEQRLWRRDVTALLDALELLGAVELGESVDGPEEHEQLVELAGRDDPDPTLVSLTPIGIWAVHEMLVEQGLHAPLVGELAEEDIEYVCVRAGRMRREVAEAELAAWVAGRPRRIGAQEIMRYLRRVEDGEHRELALHALARTATPPREQPRRVVVPGPRVECHIRAGR